MIRNLKFFEEGKYFVDANTGEVFEVLQDYSESGKMRPWREHKISNEKLEKVYRFISFSSGDYWDKKANRLHDCSKDLFFDKYEDGYLQLNHLNSCRVRLCPVCAWRRSLKIGAHVRKIVNAMEKDSNYSYLLLTLTVPNCSGALLSDTIDNMLSAFHDSFIKDSRFKKVVKGWYRGLEVTHNVNESSKSFDTYHPHFHVLLVVDTGYFTSRDYINRSCWLHMWQKATNNNNITQVDIRKVVSSGGDIVGAICEISKYTVKSKDYIIPNKWHLSVLSVYTLDSSLHHRRLVAYGGSMKYWHKKLNLDDEIDGNLLCVDDDLDLSGHGNVIENVCAFWHTGYQQYLIK